MTTETHDRSLATPRHDLRLVIAVPARLGSTRLPRKPLALLGGLPLIVRVTERLKTCVRRLGQSLGVTADNCLILVATDSPEVCDVLHATGVMTIMTPSELPSGTDRIMSALNRLPASAHQRISDSTLVINLQGDEPFFHEEDIESLVSAMLRDPNIPMGTLAYPQADPVQFMKTSVVKIVSDTLGHALYFSRSPIPWPRESLGASHSVTSVQESVDRQTALSFLQHVGVYAFRMNALKQFTSMPPSDLELCEGLEQLRALSAGWKIKLVIAHEAPFGIDTPEDLKRAEEYFATKGQKL